MAGRKSWHSEQWWATHEGGANTRCVGTLRSGEQCRRVANLGSTVCDQHGGAAPQVRARAWQRIEMASEEASKFLADLVADTTAPLTVRAQAAQDLLNRAGLADKQHVEIEVKKYERLLEAGELIIDVDPIEDEKSFKLLEGSKGNDVDL